MRVGKHLDVRLELHHILNLSRTNGSAITAPVRNQVDREYSIGESHRDRTLTYNGLPGQLWAEYPRWRGA